MKAVAVLFTLIICHSAAGKEVGEFLFVNGDLDKINLNVTRSWSSSTLDGVHVAWALESLAERERAAGITNSVYFFESPIGARNINELIDGVRRLAPSSGSLRSSSADFRFVLQTRLFPLDYYNLATVRFDDTTPLSRIYGYLVGDAVSNSPFVHTYDSTSTSFAYESQFYVPTRASSGSKIASNAKYAALPFLRRLGCYVAHYNSGEIDDLAAYEFSNTPSTHIERTWTPIKDRSVETTIDNFPSLMREKTLVYGKMSAIHDWPATSRRTTIIDATERKNNHVFRFSNGYAQSALEAYVIFRIVVHTIDWETRSVVRDEVKYALAHVETSSESIDGSVLSNIAKSCMESIGVHMSDVANPPHDDIRGGEYTESYVYANLIQVYEVLNLRNRTKDWWL